MRRTPKARRRATRRLTVPSGLYGSQYEFCLHYLANGFNASAAYRSTHPGVTNGTSRVEGHRTLANPNVQAFLAQQIKDRWKARQMDGDEALGRVAMDARADIRLLFDENGVLLKPQDWPDEIANSVESVDLKNGKVKLASKLAALRIILEQTGTLNTPSNDIDVLAAAIREGQERHRHHTSPVMD